MMYCDECGSFLREFLTKCEAGVGEGDSCNAGSIRVKDQIIRNCRYCYRKWRIQKIQGLWETENALVWEQRKFFESNQPHRVNQHRDKARRARELYHARLDVANALQYIRRQINAFERQYMGDTGAKKLGRHALNSADLDPDVSWDFRYRIEEEEDGRTYIDRCWNSSSVGTKPVERGESRTILGRLAFLLPGA